MYIEFSQLGINSSQAQAFLDKIIARREEDSRSSQILQGLPSSSPEASKWFDDAVDSVHNAFRSGVTAIRLLSKFSKAQQSGSFLSILSDSQLLLDISDVDLSNIRRDISTLLDVVQLPFSQAMVGWVDSLSEGSPYRLAIRPQNKMHRITTAVILCEVFFNRNSSADQSIIDRCAHRFSDSVHNYLCYVHHFVQNVPSDQLPQMYRNGVSATSSTHGNGETADQVTRSALNKLLNQH